MKSPAKLIEHMDPPDGYELPARTWLARLYRHITFIATELLSFKKNELGVPQNGTNVGSSLRFKIITDPTQLMSHFSSIRLLADSERTALGFLPEAAIKDAIQNGRLIAMLALSGEASTLAGYILFSGVYPNARVQQIAVSSAYRRSRIGATLVNNLIATLEQQGFLVLTAAVADDLHVAQKFYSEQGFVARTTRAGGLARGRKIIVRARYLSNPSFFPYLEEPADGDPATELGLHPRGTMQAPIYSIDLNVLFDAVKSPNRARGPLAERLIGAALAHQFRLAVAPEFVSELERTSQDGVIDPILALARRLPRLPEVDTGDREKLAHEIREIVFTSRGNLSGKTEQSLSDCQHLAHAALARVSGYVTSDGAILAARTELRKRIGIDVASLEEFVEILADVPSSLQPMGLQGTGCNLDATSLGQARNYLAGQYTPSKVIEEFCSAPDVTDSNWSVSVTEDGNIIGIGILKKPKTVDAPARLLVHIRPDHIASDVFADKIIDVLCHEACRAGPAGIELTCIAGQTLVRHAAIQRGFLQTSFADVLVKVAVGRPITNSSWLGIAQQMRRKTKLVIPDAIPVGVLRDGLAIQRPDGSPATVRIQALEEALSPTILVWPGRVGAIVPIGKSYADDLLGTDRQYKLFGSPEASFATRKTYFCSPRAERVLRPSMPILFYESVRTGGQGAITAAARIYDASVVKKDEMPPDLIRRAVVDDVESFSKSPEVLAVSFNTVMPLPRPVSFAELKRLGAVGTANLQMSTQIDGDSLAAILDYGWSRV